MSVYQRILLRALSSRVLGTALERMLRRSVWEIEQGTGTGLKLRLPQNRDYILGLSEPPVQRALAEYLHPGDVFYDIGANVGFFSLLAARTVGPGGCVCAFEPVAANAESIRDNADLNDLRNLRVLEMAIGRSARVAEFLLTGWDGGGSLSEAAVRPSDVVSRVDVRVAALDDMIRAEGLPQPDLVKIDVEGAEMDVLAGMSATIRDRSPVLLYEVDDEDRAEFQRRWRELDSYVTGFGYEVRHLESSYPNERWQVGHSLAVPGLANCDRSS